MKQLTLRILDQDLLSCLKRLAGERGLSLGEAALVLLRRGAALTAPLSAEARVGESLDEFIGSWSQQDERDILQSIGTLGQADQSAWK